MTTQPLLYSESLVGETLEFLMPENNGNTKFLLQMFNPAGQGRLRHIAAFRCPTKVAFLLKRNNVVKLAKKHVPTPWTVQIWYGGITVYRNPPLVQHGVGRTMNKQYRRWADEPEWCMPVLTLPVFLFSCASRHF